MKTLCSALALAVVALTFAAESRAGSLEEAYAREAKALRVEASALEAALDSRRSELNETKAALARKIEILSGELITLRAANEAAEAELPARERSVATEDSERELREVIERASLWLKVEGGQELDDSPAPEMLPQAFAAVFASIEREGTRRIEEAEIFDTQGAARQAKVLRLGGVAALSQENLVPLAPVEKGGFREVGSDGAPRMLGEINLARALLYDPQSETTWSIEGTRGLTDYLVDGGFIMWPLALLGLVVLLLSLERSTMLLAHQRNWQHLAAEIDEIAKDHAWDRALAPSTAAKPLLSAPFTFVLNHRELGRRALEERVEELFSRIRPRFVRGLTLLGAIAAAAPLLGLLGTVTGMIGTFEVITHEGTGDPRLLSAGISQALLTTQLGLTIAIPALLLHTLFNRWARGLHGRIATRCAELIHHIEDAALHEEHHEHS